MKQAIGYFTLDEIPEADMTLDEEDLPEAGHDDDMMVEVDEKMLVQELRLMKRNN